MLYLFISKREATKRKKSLILGKLTSIDAVKIFPLVSMITQFGGRFFLSKLAHLKLARREQFSLNRSITLKNDA